LADNEGDFLDGTLINAASHAGVNMVDVRGQFAGHGVCGNGGAWIKACPPRSEGGSSQLVRWVVPSDISGQGDGYAAAFEITSTPRRL